MCTLDLQRVCVCVCVCVCVTAARKTTYKVYVAAVNGAGHGEWEETRDPVSTKGLTSEYIQWMPGPWDYYCTVSVHSLSSHSRNIIGD